MVWALMRNSPSSMPHDTSRRYQYQCYRPLVGVIAGGLLYGPVAGSRWGWRGMYFIGIAPLLLVAFLRRNLRETARFTELKRKHRSETSLVDGLRENVAQAFRALGGPYRGRLLLVAMLWNCVMLVGAPAVTFFSLYAIRDRHWTRGQVGSAVVLAYIIGTFVRTRPRRLHARSRRAEAHDLRVIRGRRRRDHAALPDRGPYRDAHCDGRDRLRVPGCAHRDRDLFGGTVSHRDSRDVL